MIVEASYGMSFIHHLAGVDFDLYNTVTLFYDFEYTGAVRQAAGFDFIGVFSYRKD